MKIRILTLILLFFFYACKYEKTTDEKWQELKQADFTNLLKYANDFVETPYFDSICERLNDTIAAKKYAFVDIENQYDSVSKVISLKYKLIDIHSRKYSCCDIKERNLFLLCIRNQDSVLINDELITQEDINTCAKNFLTNPSDEYHLSEKKQVEIELIGTAMVPKGTLILLIGDSFNHQLSRDEWIQYFSIINEFHKVYFDLRNEFSNSFWNKLYFELNYEEKVAVNQLYPCNIELNFVWSCGIPLPPPPPPLDIHEVLNIPDD